MASTYTNDLRLELIATGEAAATWGDKTNTNLTNIAAAFGYATQDGFAANADATTTVADGAADPARAMYFKVTSSATLTTTRTLTIAPNTISRVMWIENATTGGQSIAISQGTGANVTIATGKTAVVYLDGAGSGAAVVDAMAGVSSGASDTLAEILASGNTTGGTDISVSTGDDITFADSSKAIFGADSDLQIYHDGTNSYIKDNGVGDLIIQAYDDIKFQQSTDNADLVTINTGGNVTIHGGNLDVTGSVTADGLVNNGDVVFSKSSTGVPTLKMSGFAGANSPYGVINFYNEDGSQQGPNNAVQIKALAKNSDGSGGELAFYTSTGTSSEGADAVERFRIDSSGNVGIGTDSPQEKTHSAGRILSTTTHSGATQRIGTSIGQNGNTNADIDFRRWTGAGTNHGVGVIEVDAAGVMAFYTDNKNSNTPATSERLRIDSSGNLLVGTTDSVIWNEAATDTSKEGVVIEPKSIQISRFEDTPLLINRQGNEGTLQVFAQDGTTVGSIGTYDGADIYVGSGDTGIRFVPGEDAVIPVSPSSSGSIRGSAIDLGLSGIPFSSLYLSGGVYLGGTGAANKLEDYEEGDYDCTVTCSTSGTVTLNTLYNRAGYTKVGRLVTVHGFIVVSSVSSPVGYFKISLPFAAANLTNRAGDSTATLVAQNVASANVADFVASVNEGSAEIIVQLGDSTAVQNDSAQELQANTYISFSTTYSAA